MPPSWPKVSRRSERQNAQGEYYLTDLVEIANRKGLRCSAYPVADPMEVMGINTRVDLAVAHEVTPAGEGEGPDALGCHGDRS